MKSRIMRKGQLRPIGTLDFLYNRGYMSPSISSQLTDRYADSRMNYPERIQFRRDLVGHYGCVNAIEFSNLGGRWIASGGDDKRVLMWNTEMAVDGISKPVEMIGEHNSNIFCLAFDNENNKIFSGGNDEQVVVHDIETRRTLDVFLHKDAIYGLAVDPNNSNVFASACDDGRVLVCDIRLPPSDEPFVLANYMSAMHAVEYNPVDPRLLATANASEGIALWDIRQPGSCLMRYGGALLSQSCMSVRFNYRGDQLLALRRKLPPVLYSLHSPAALCQFDSKGYHNSCTMKSCSYAGTKDQYVLSGSDDFKLYMWKVPDDLSLYQSVKEAHVILSGHRSIVNQVRYNPDNSLIISSGVEKIIKAWSPYNADKDESKIDVSAAEEPQRPSMFQHGIDDMILDSGPGISHDYSHRSTNEDPHMIAFFNSLVRREREEEEVDEYLTSDLDIAAGYSDDFVHTDLSLDSSSDDDSSNSSNFSHLHRHNRDMLVNVRAWRRNRRRRQIGSDYDDEYESDENASDEDESENFWDLDSGSDSSSNSSSGTLPDFEASSESGNDDENSSKLGPSKNRPSAEQSTNENEESSNQDNSSKTKKNDSKMSAVKSNNIPSQASKTNSDSVSNLQESPVQNSSAGDQGKEVGVVKRKERKSDVTKKPKMISVDSFYKKRHRNGSDSVSNVQAKKSQCSSAKERKCLADVVKERKEEHEPKFDVTGTSLTISVDPFYKKCQNDGNNSTSSDSESSDNSDNKEKLCDSHKLKKISSYRHLRKRHSSLKKDGNNIQAACSNGRGETSADESSTSIKNENILTEQNKEKHSSLASGNNNNDLIFVSSSKDDVRESSVTDLRLNSQSNGCGESSRASNDETSQAWYSKETNDKHTVETKLGGSNSDNYSEQQSAEVVRTFAINRLKRLRSEAMSNDFSAGVELFGQKKMSVHCFHDDSTRVSDSAKSSSRILKKYTAGSPASSTASVGSCELNKDCDSKKTKLGTASKEKGLCKTESNNAAALSSASICGSAAAPSTTASKS